MKISSEIHMLIIYIILSFSNLDQTLFYFHFIYKN